MGGFSDPFFGSVDLLKQLTELRETFYLLGYRFIRKGCNLGTVRYKEMHRALYGARGAECPLSECASLPAPPRVHQPGSSLKPVILGFFMEASFHRHD